MRSTAPARSLRALSLGVLCSLALTAMTAPVASAGPLASSAASCSTYTFGMPFSAWGDWNAYTFVPAGSLESTSWSTNWTVSGGAKRVAGNESFHVNSSTDAYSLYLPAGSSATTRAMCAGIDYPTVRFFAKNAGASTSTLKVEVLFEDLSGGVHSLKIANLSAGSTWKPTSPIYFIVNVLGAATASGTTPVAFRFTPQGTGGSWQIDDVYVDPYKRR